MTDINELAKALVAAQAEMRNPSFDSANPHFKNKFASLAQVRNTIVPVLAKHGLSVVQDLTTTERGVGCTTILIHESGQTMSFGPLVMPATKPDAQGLGSAATYARRYSLMAVCNVVGDVDDDANAASEPKHTKADPLDRDNLTVNGDHRAYALALVAPNADILGIIEDLKREGEEFYRAVWSMLDSKTRSAIKRTLAGEAA